LYSTASKESAYPTEEFQEIAPKNASQKHARHRVRVQRTEGENRGDRKLPHSGKKENTKVKGLQWMTGAETTRGRGKHGVKKDSSHKYTNGQKPLRKKTKRRVFSKAKHEKGPRSPSSRVAPKGIHLSGRKTLKLGL